jgi:hypothetical protein
VLVVHMMNNGFRMENGYEPSPSKETDVTIWGGDLFNCGESDVSRLVFERREHLKRFVCIPQNQNQNHKGGRMIRPHYYRGDRTSTMTFPSLKTLGYYEDRGTPQDARWLAPNLETLYVFQGPRYENSSMRILDRWAVKTGDRGLPQRVLEESPNLKEIVFCAKPDFSVPFQFQTRRRLVAPSSMPAGSLRVLGVAIKKENAETCPMAMLPAGVMSHIVDFCHSPHWKTFDYDEDNEEE